MKPGDYEGAEVDVPREGKSTPGGDSGEGRGSSNVIPTRAFSPKGTVSVPFLPRSTGNYLLRVKVGEEGRQSTATEETTIAKCF